MSVQIMSDEDWPQVRSIFIEGLATGLSSLEESAPDWNSWNESHISSCRLVHKTDDKVDGWAALSPVSGRCVYGGVAEVSVYIAASKRGKGIGKILLQRLVAESEKHGYWTLQAGILSENKISIALHQSCGFRIVGIREKLGKLKDQWKDIILMERRSKTVGL